jgi:hypothetical protein
MARREQERLARGWKGKGIKGFVSFCKPCHWEYGLATENCHYCKRPTMTPEARTA